ncbi:HIT-type Zinc finger family protein, putative isoform 2 [Hibiscus syriacus]|uniref:HIT-type Zinc finger family protein, putative isoform 2 n=1 Tax=Hibiscus syriacus TaxID=106335 RepID=A0A6A2XM97_HIBSY|nr:HIT-type Zinc finger family protein, putative isoform 2 [Hibiscus syriacus]
MVESVITGFEKAIVPFQLLRLPSSTASLKPNGNLSRFLLFFGLVKLWHLFSRLELVFELEILLQGLNLCFFSETCLDSSKHPFSSYPSNIDWNSVPALDRWTSKHQKNLSCQVISSWLMSTGDFKQISCCFKKVVLSELLWRKIPFALFLIRKVQKERKWRIQEKVIVKNAKRRRQNTSARVAASAHAVSLALKLTSNAPAAMEKGTSLPLFISLNLTIIFSSQLPYPLRTLRTVVASRRTKLLFLPSGMSRRETTQTLVVGYMKYKTTPLALIENINIGGPSPDVNTATPNSLPEIELTAGGIALLIGKHSERTHRENCRKHFSPGAWNHPLRRFCEEQLDCLKFFIRKYPKGKSPFREFDIKAPIRQQLADTVVLEYPVIHVFLPMEHYDFEIIRENLPDNEIQNGVTFREEEIKENGNSLDSRVFDLMRHVHQIPSHNKSEKALGNLVVFIN